MHLATLIDHVKLRLLQPLPGRAVQLSLYSKEGLNNYEILVKKYEQESDMNTARQSSVMILLYEKEDQLFIPLIKRPDYEGVHSGQIALPGGKVEPEDENVIATALRETQEEIGIASTDIHVLGQLTPVFIPPSHFWVNVVIGYYKGVPNFIPDAHEVASMIELPLTHLEESRHIEERPVTGSSKGWQMKAPGYVYDNHFIWGATSMILTELREIMH